jgi:rare lipoprotein A
VGLALCVGLVAVPLLCLRSAASPAPRRALVTSAATVPERSFAARVSRSMTAERVVLPAVTAPTVPAPTSAPSKVSTKKTATTTHTTPRPLLRSTTVEVQPRATTTTTVAPRAKATPTTAAPKAKATTTTMAPPKPAPPAAHEQRGRASYYTGSDPAACAHRTAPMGTVIHVTNVANGKSVDCRVVTRGPFVDGRVIDLTEATFARIASVDSGVIEVMIRW